MIEARLNRVRISTTFLKEYSYLISGIDDRTSLTIQMLEYIEFSGLHIFLFSNFLFQQNCRILILKFIDCLAFYLENELSAFRRRRKKIQFFNNFSVSGGQCQCQMPIVI